MREMDRLEHSKHS